jgi:hypothetical protein
MGSWGQLVRISITSAAFDAIAATLPLSTVGFECEPDANGERLVSLAPHVLNGLRALRGPFAKRGRKALRREAHRREARQAQRGR